jgi:hypothetical protein
MAAIDAAVLLPALWRCCTRFDQAKGRLFGAVALTSEVDHLDREGMAASRYKAGRHPHGCRWYRRRDYHYPQSAISSDYA